MAELKNECRIVEIIENKKSSDPICLIDGKITFIKTAKGEMVPKRGETWTILITEQKERVNIAEPLFFEMSKAETERTNEKKAIEAFKKQKTERKKTRKKFKYLSKNEQQKEL